MTSRTGKRVIAAAMRKWRMRGCPTWDCVGKITNKNRAAFLDAELDTACANYDRARKRK